MSEGQARKYIVVSGGVLSGLGKGITASSIGVLMQVAGYKVSAIKIDPYLNRNAGKMSPYEHGEVYVLNDGAEADLDLGNYERFLGLELTQDHNITTGKVYSAVIEREGEGGYLGKTVQVVPHITDEIQERIVRAADHGSPDICMIELGGTVGDMESAPFVEALRQFRTKIGRDNMCWVHVSLVPVMGSVGEQKTKPTQQSVRTLMGLGVTPDILVCRSETPIGKGVRTKLSVACGIAPDHILSAHDVSDIYMVPSLLNGQSAAENLCEVLRLPNPCDCLGAATSFQNVLEAWTPTPPHKDAPRISVAVVGKYVGLLDSYLSIARAIGHAGFSLGVHTEIVWIDAEELDPDDSTTLAPLLQCDCAIVPGGFGDRGVEGKILACQQTRENKIPTLGICLGMQTMLCDYYRNMVGHTNAVIGEMQEEGSMMILRDLGKMRLGLHPLNVCVRDSEYSRLHGGAVVVQERYRHRFGLPSRKLTGDLQEVGRCESAMEEYCGAVELKGHPYYIGVQYHPEFRSRPNAPSPLFVGLLKAVKMIR